MKFIFVSAVEAKASGKWNGFTARFTQGIGGTETAMMYMAEHLAEQNHQVMIVSLADALDEINYNHVQYINFSNFTSQECDYLILTNHIQTSDILKKISSYQYAFIVTHALLGGNQTQYTDIIFQHQMKKTIFLYISQNAKTEIKRIFPFVNNFQDLVIENCLNSNEVQPITTKENAFCFFPCVERGLQECLNVCQQFPTFKCYLSTYYQPFFYMLQNNSQCTPLQNTSKLHIYEALAKSKYFLYSTFVPQKQEFAHLPKNGLFHYDTFAYVIYEALIHGVIVITVPMDVYLELYGDAVYYIPIDRKYLNQDDMIPHPELSEYISNEFVKAVELFESSPSLQQLYLEKGKQLLCKYNQTASIQKLFSFLQLPYQPITYQYLFLVSTPNTSTTWNGYLNCPSTLQHIITFAEQNEKVVICSIENQMIPVHHNNVLYCNYQSLPSTSYERVIIIHHNIPINLLSSIQYTSLFISNDVESTYKTLSSLPYQGFSSLRELLSPSKTMRILFFNSNNDEQVMNLATNLSQVTSNCVEMVSLGNTYSSSDLEKNNTQIRFFNWNEIPTKVSYDVIFLLHLEEEMTFVTKIENVRKIIYLITTDAPLNIMLLQKLKTYLILCYSSITLQNKLVTHYHLRDFNNITFPVSVLDYVIPSHSFHKENQIGILGTTNQMDKELLSNLKEYSICSMNTNPTYDTMLYLLVLTDELYQFDYQILDALRHQVQVILPNLAKFKEWFGSIPIYYDVSGLVNQDGHFINRYAVLLRMKHQLLLAMSTTHETINQVELQHMFPNNGQIVTNYLQEKIL